MVSFRSCRKMIVRRLFLLHDTTRAASWIAGKQCVTRNRAIPRDTLPREKKKLPVNKFFLKSSSDRACTIANFPAPAGSYSQSISFVYEKYPKLVSSPSFKFLDCVVPGAVVISRSMARRASIQEVICEMMMVRVLGWHLGGGTSLWAVCIALKDTALAKAL